VSRCPGSALLDAYRFARCLCLFLFFYIKFNLMPSSAAVVLTMSYKVSVLLYIFRWYVKVQHTVPLFYAYLTLSVNLQYLGKLSVSPPPLFGTIFRSVLDRSYHLIHLNLIWRLNYLKLRSWMFHHRLLYPAPLQSVLYLKCSSLAQYETYWSNKSVYYNNFLYILLQLISHIFITSCTFLSAPYLHVGLHVLL